MADAGVGQPLPLPPPTEITNKAGFLPRVLARATAVTAAFICKWQMNQKSVWNFSPNFVCLLVPKRAIGTRLWLPTQYIPILISFHRQILNITEMLYFAPTCNASAADSL